LETIEDDSGRARHFYCNRLEAPHRIEAIVSGLAVAVLAAIGYFAVLRHLGIPSWIGLPVSLAILGSVSLELSLGCEVALDNTAVGLRWRTRKQAVPYETITSTSVRNRQLVIVTESMGVFLVRSPWWRGESESDIARLAAGISAHLKR